MGFKPQMKIKKNIKFLSKDEEYSILCEYQKTQNPKLANKILNANLGFIIQIASKFNKSKVSFDDIIQEGCLGYLAALNKFKPKLNLRFNTYAVYWIKAYITIYIYKNSFDVKVGRSAPMMKLYFQLNKLKNLTKSEYPYLEEIEILQKISEKLNIDINHVLTFNDLLKSNDDLTNSKISCQNLNPEESLLKKEIPNNIMQKLNQINFQDREKEIIHTKFLSAQEGSLKDLSSKFNVSRQRIQQIEIQSFNKIKENFNKETFLN